MNTGTIKAIETSYKGYRFRSRLEARWAVLFDAEKIPWQYEVEGYDLDGDWYLPDFWLPEHEFFVEIKPHFELMESVSVQCFEQAARPIRCFDLAMRLARGSGHHVVIASGDCWPGGYRLFTFHGGSDLDQWDQCDDNASGGWACSSLSRCRRCDGLSYMNYFGEYRGDWERWGDLGKHSCRNNEKDPIVFLDSHYRAARSARFEYGESGLPSPCQ